MTAAAAAPAATGASTRAMFLKFMVFPSLRLSLNCIVHDPGMSNGSPGREGKDSRGCRFMLAQNAEICAPELAVIHRGDRRAEPLGEAGQPVDEQLRARLVGGETVLRVVEHVRVREVRVRAVDQRDVAVRDGGRR